MIYAFRLQYISKKYIFIRLIGLKLLQGYRSSSLQPCFELFEPIIYFGLILDSIRFCRYGAFYDRRPYVSRHSNEQWLNMTNNIGMNYLVFLFCRQFSRARSFCLFSLNAPLTINNIQSRLWVQAFNVSFGLIVQHCLTRMSKRSMPKVHSFWLKMKV